MKKKRLIAIVGGIILACIVAVIVIDSQLSENGRNSGFTASPVEHDGLSYELVGSDYTGDSHTFHFAVKNVGDNPARLSSVFAIVSGDKRYKSSDVSYSDSELNPDMSGTIDVTFEMPGEALTETESAPVIVIDRGLFVKDTVEITLVK